jgi:hypothetical protein
MIKIEASGDGYLIRGKEISQKTYEHFKDDSDLLEQHVTQYEDDTIPEEISIGIHDDCDEMTVYGMQLNSSSLDIDCDGEQQTIELTEENIKKLEINCKNESVTLLADADDKLRADKKIVMAKTKAQIKNFKKRGLN